MAFSCFSRACLTSRRPRNWVIQAKFWPPRASRWKNGGVLIVFVCQNVDPNIGSFRIMMKHELRSEAGWLVEGSVFWSTVHAVGRCVSVSLQTQLKQIRKVARGNKWSTTSTSFNSGHGDLAENQPEAGIRESIVSDPTHIARNMNWWIPLDGDWRAGMTW